MKKIIKKLSLLAGIAAFAFMFVVPLSGQLAAATKDEVCEGLELTGGGGCDAASANSQVEEIITTVVDILSLVVGVLSVIMIIIGGLKYITSGGDSNSTQSAKNTILYAIIGLVIVALAQVIVRFVLGRV